MSDPITPKDLARLRELCGAEDNAPVLTQSEQTLVVLALPKLLDAAERVQELELHIKNALELLAARGESELQIMLTELGCKTIDAIAPAFDQLATERDALRARVGELEAELSGTPRA